VRLGSMAAGAEEIVRPRRLIGASGRPLNFTVRRTCSAPGLLRALRRLRSGDASAGPVR
jgi:hypothetical protein